MLYMVQGYVFISIYNFIRFKQNDLNHLFFKSIVTSYILKVLFDWIFVKSIIIDEAVVRLVRIFNVEYESSIYCILLLIFSVILSFVSARIIQHEKFNDFLMWIGIKRTTNSSVWEDVIKPNCWLMVYLSSSESVYFGQYKYGEEFVNKPLIVLEHYKIMDLDGNTKTDCSESSDIAVIDTKNIERIEIAYQDNGRSK